MMDAVIAFLGAVVIAIGGFMGGLGIRNYRMVNKHDQKLGNIEDRMGSAERQGEQNVRLLTGVAYTLDRMVSRLNESEELDVDVEGLAFRDDFIRGGDGGPVADGGGLGPMEGESLGEYRERVREWVE